MSLLQKAKGKASEVAREAADASARAADAVSARAHDHETQERLKSGLATAGRSAADASARAAGASVKAAGAAAGASVKAAGAAADVSAKAAGAAVAKVQDPATQARVKHGIASAGRGARTLVERIDPGILADVVIKATALQERANARLRSKGSIYRIGEIQVTASLPPGISFSIERVAEAEDEAASGRLLRSSTELLAEGRAAETEAIVSLDTHEQAAIAEGLAEAEASMDATVDVLDGTPRTSRTPGEASTD